MNNKKIFILIALLITLVFSMAVSSAEVEYNVNNPQDAIINTDYSIDDYDLSDDNYLSEDKVSVNQDINQTNDKYETSTVFSVDLTDDQLCFSSLVFDDDNDDVDINEGVVYFLADNTLVKVKSDILYVDVIKGAAECEVALDDTELNSDKIIEFKAVYNGSNNYQSSTSELLRVNLSNIYDIVDENLIATTTTLDVYKDDDTITLSACVYDNEDNIINDSKVYFMADNVYIEDEDGLAVYAVVTEASADIELPLDYFTDNNDNIIFKAVYDGTDKYQPSTSQSQTLTLKEDILENDTLLKTKTILNAEYINNSLYLNTSVMDENNTILNYAKVYFMINNQILTDKYSKNITAYVKGDYETIVVSIDDLESYLKENDMNLSDDSYTVDLKAVFFDNKVYDFSMSDVVSVKISNPSIGFDKYVTTDLLLLSYADEYGVYLYSNLITEDNTLLTLKDAVYFMVDDEIIQDDYDNIITADVNDGKISATIDNYLLEGYDDPFELKAVFTGNGRYLSTESNKVTISIPDEVDEEQDSSETLTSLLCNYQDESTVSLITVVTDRYSHWIEDNGYVYYMINNDRILTYQNGSVITGNIVDSSTVVEVPTERLWIDNTDIIEVKALYCGSNGYLDSSSDNIELSYYNNHSVSTTVHTTKTYIDDIIVDDDLITIQTKTTYSNSNIFVKQGSVYFIIDDEKLLCDNDNNPINIRVSYGKANITVNKDILFTNKNSIKIKAVYNTTALIDSFDESIVDVYLKSMSENICINITDEDILVEGLTNNYNISLILTEDEDTLYLKAIVKTRSGIMVNDSIVKFSVYDKKFISQLSDGIAICNISKDYLLNINHKYYDDTDSIIHYYPINAAYLGYYTESNNILYKITTDSNSSQSDKLIDTRISILSNTNLTGQLFYVLESVDESNNTIKYLKIHNMLDDEFKQYDDADNVFFILNDEKFITKSYLDTSFDGMVKAVFIGAGPYKASVSKEVEIHFKRDLSADNTQRSFGLVTHITTSKNTKVTTDDSNNNQASNNNQNTKTSTSKTQITTKETKSLTKQMVKVVADKTYSIILDNKEVYTGTILTLKSLADIFNIDFTNNVLVIYLDGKVIFNDTVDDNLEIQVLKLIESLIGNHELKIEYLDADQTKVIVKNITIQ